jgi:uncharacterized protein (TIGR02246 family)
MNHDAARALHRQLLDAWNARDAAGFAALFAHDGVSIGFDGTEVIGRPDIARHLGEIFASHPTPRYLGKIHEVRALSESTALVRAVAGMIPCGAEDLDPKLHTVQTLVVHAAGGTWRIALLQSTPAQFHGRPEAVEALTRELQAQR